LKISRKEAKESEYWLKLLREMNARHKGRIEKLEIEAIELRKILSSIINKLN